MPFEIRPQPQSKLGSPGNSNNAGRRVIHPWMILTGPAFKTGPQALRGPLGTQQRMALTIHPWMLSRGGWLFEACPQPQTVARSSFAACSRNTDTVTERSLLHIRLPQANRKPGGPWPKRGLGLLRLRSLHLGPITDYTSTSHYTSLDDIYGGSLFGVYPQPQPQRVPLGTPTRSSARHTSLDDSYEILLSKMGPQPLRGRLGRRHRSYSHDTPLDVIYGGVALRGAATATAYVVPLGAPTTR